VTELRERDVKMALELAFDAGRYAGSEPFPAEFLEHLTELIPTDALAGYHEAVLGVPAGTPCRVVESIEIPATGLAPEVQEAGGRLLEQDPIRHRLRRRERRALKLSDFLTRRQLRKLDFYWYVWRPSGIDDSLRVWLPAPEGRSRVIYLERGKRNFTERERSILELLRPSLIKMQARAERRRDQQERPRGLTKREMDILRLIAAGHTTREVAGVLVISPHTARKHIENILEKLGVRTRSAAVALLFGAQDSPTPPRSRQLVAIGAQLGELSLPDGS
jgi:DNA-binding CsgD family transcriptional regulator